MQSELVSMGIASPVTKAAAGARYHQELAAQVTRPRWSFGHLETCLYNFDDKVTAGQLHMPWRLDDVVWKTSGGFM